MNQDITFKKNTDFSDWYREIVIKGELIDYYDVKGCYILLPNACTIWENIKRYLDDELKNRGVENYYFPLFLTKTNLEKEQNFLEGFKAEVAWINDNECKNALRPTSECIICPSIAKKIRSHSDLPKKINQYCNVVRNEIKETVPFIRSREFLWQEGHSFYDNYNDARDEVIDIINLYQNIYEKMLAVPVILGLKTKSETFAGAEYTYTIEGFIPEAQKAIQCATAHSLGHNFSKMFDISYLDKNMNKEYCFYNSWGITTRSIGVMIQTHSDNRGLVFPPKIAPIHIVIIPIHNKKNMDFVINSAKTLYDHLVKYFNVKLDISKNTPGYKYNHWELRGVPLRIELGEKEIKNKTITIVRRDNMEKYIIPQFDIDKIKNIMDIMQNELYNSAKLKLLSSIKFVDKTNIDNFVTKNIVVVKFCGNIDCEKCLKDKHGIKSLCLPKDDKINLPQNEFGCIVCDGITDNYCLFSKSY